MNGNEDELFASSSVYGGNEEILRFYRTQQLFQMKLGANTIMSKKLNDRMHRFGYNACWAKV